MSNDYNPWREPQQQPDAGQQPSYPQQNFDAGQSYQPQGDNGETVFAPKPTQPTQQLPAYSDSAAYPGSASSAAYPTSAASAAYPNQQQPYGEQAGQGYGQQPGQQFAPQPGQPVQPGPGAPTHPGGPTLMNTLTDFGFKVFGTRQLAKPLWLFAVILAVVSWLAPAARTLVSILTTSSEGSYGTSLTMDLVGQFLLGWIGPFVTLLFTRVLLEFFVSAHDKRHQELGGR